MRDSDRRIVFLNLAAVFEFGRMKSSPPLSTFDRIGVAVVAFLGTCLGWKISTANDIVFTLVLAVIFPGAVVGFAVLKFVGGNIVGIVSVANGAIYGLVLYGWNRIANRISGRDQRPKRFRTCTPGPSNSANRRWPQRCLRRHRSPSIVKVELPSSDPASGSARACRPNTLPPGPC